MFALAIMIMAFEVTYNVLCLLKDASKKFN